MRFLSIGGIFIWLAGVVLIWVLYYNLSRGRLGKLAWIAFLWPIWFILGKYDLWYIRKEKHKWLGR